MLAFFDCFSSVAGDMLIGSLLDAGASFEVLQHLVDSLGLDVTISTDKRMVSGISSTQFTVQPGQAQPIRHLADITQIIQSAAVSEDLKETAFKIFERLAQAEAQVHGTAPEHIHFHEIGAVDTIIDILGTLVCLHQLQITKIISSPLCWNSGFIDISHGTYPLPAPATALLLKNVPVLGSACRQELVTPTGAAILTTVCHSFGAFPLSTVRAIGYGAGTLARDDGVPNLLRVVVSEDNMEALLPFEQVGVIETEIDDMNPEFFTHLFDLVQVDPGIFDMYTTPVTMKKNRPGFLITVIVQPCEMARVTALLLANTTSLGCRCRLESRYCLERSFSALETPWGSIQIKTAHFPGGEVRMKPEFADCQRIARTHRLPLGEVYAVINQLLSATRA
jgi:uncharacterized protein (TIGR00299 family) protein